MRPSILICALAISITAVSCKKSSNSTPAQAISVPINDSFYARVDGQSFLGFDFGGSYFYPASIFTLEAHGLGVATHNGIFLTFPDVSKPAHYNLAASQPATAQYEEDTTHYVITDGTLDVLADNSAYVTGRFSFTASAGGQSRAITDGYFFFHK